MSSGYDVCVVKQGDWVVYSFFEADEEYDALYLAKDLKNNYKEVCVLCSREMAVIYHHAKDGATKPKYLDVRKNIKLAKEKREKSRGLVKRSAVLRKPVPANAPTAQDVSDGSEGYTKDDHKRTVANTLMVALSGAVLTAITPLVMFDFSMTSRMITMISIITTTGVLSVLTFTISEKSAREKNKKKSLESAEVWDDIKSSSFADKADHHSQNLQQEEQQEEVQLQEEISLPEKPLDTTSNEMAQEFAEEDDNYPDDQEWVILPEVDLSAGLDIASTEEVSEHIDDYFAAPEDSGDEDDENSVEKEALNLLFPMTDMAKNIAWDEERETLKEDLNFAFTLYAAGAIMKLVDMRGEQNTLLYKTVPLALTRLNMNPHLIEGYLVELKDYLKYPQYMATYRHGENDAARYLNLGEQPSELQSAFNLWLTNENNSVASNLEEESLQTRFMAILFTDIVSFTENTRTKGGDWMRDVVRAHNDIIRKILSECGGQEIKHTGDGILATFASVNSAADAALMFQKSLSQFNEAMPTREFHVRIGINAGEVIEMDNDVFGESVNLAARLMQYCNGGQIIISNTVKNIVADRSGYQLATLDNITLKGFESQSIYILTQEETS